MCASNRWEAGLPTANWQWQHCVATRCALWQLRWLWSWQWQWQCRGVRGQGSGVRGQRSEVGNEKSGVSGAFVADGLQVRCRWIAGSLQMDCRFVADGLHIRCTFVARSLHIHCGFVAGGVAPAMQSIFASVAVSRRVGAWRAGVGSPASVNWQQSVVFATEGDRATRLKRC
jgi:hypothetical protein